MLNELRVTSPDGSQAHTSTLAHDPKVDSSSLDRYQVNSKEDSEMQRGSERRLKGKSSAGDHMLLRIVIGAMECLFTLAQKMLDVLVHHLCMSSSPDFRDVGDGKEIDST